ncbi:SMI1/KNR4 family protein [Nocardia puris]|uniref:SMI1/KNR4 family protein n=1 Tax=Nocardia puris TaxID=208602 RepID=UPI002E1CC35F
MRDWETLIASISREIDRADRSAPIDGQPRPGATEHAITAAEHRLGFAFDPVYREFLGHVDGWPHFNADESTLYSLDELGSDAWREDCRDLVDWGAPYTEFVADPLGMPPLERMLLASGRYRLTLSLLLVPPEDSGANGRVVQVGSELTVHDDFYTYLSAELESWTFYNDRYST